MCAADDADIFTVAPGTVLKWGDYEPTEAAAATAAAAVVVVVAAAAAAAVVVVIAVVVVVVVIVVVVVVVVSIVLFVVVVVHPGLLGPFSTSLYGNKIMIGTKFCQNSDL